MLLILDLSQTAKEIEITQRFLVSGALAVSLMNRETLPTL